MKVKLQYKIFIPISLILIIGNLIAFIVIRYNSKNAIVKQIEEEIEAVAHSVSGAVIAKNDDTLRTLEVLSVLPEFMDPNVSLDDKAAILFHVLENCEQTYYNMYISDTRGYTRIYGSDSYYDVTEKEFFQKAMAGNPYIGLPFFADEEKTVMEIIYSYPVKDINGNVINVITSISDAYQLSDICATFSPSANTNTVLVDRESGFVIASALKVDVDLQLNNFKYVAAMERTKELAAFMDTVANLLSGGNATGKYYVQDKTKGIAQEMIVAYEEVEGTPWSVMVPAPFNDFNSIINMMIKKIMIVMIVVIVIIVVLGIMLVKGAIHPLIMVKNAISDLSSGNADLTKRIFTKAQDEIGDVVFGVNKFTSKLHDIVKELDVSRDSLDIVGTDLDAITQDTTDSVNQIIEQINIVGEQIQSQGASVTETAGAVNEIASNIESLDRLIQSQTAGVTEASAAVEQMIGNIRSVNVNVEKMANSFSVLEQEAQNGSSIQEEVNQQITLIENQSETLQEANSAIAAIAEQTNLLAMNAAIEAAHAGEAGKGFSVVADEIRKLSETSTTQSKTIGDQLVQIQNLIVSVVSASEESSKAFNAVAARIKETDELVGQIKCAMEEQEQGSQQIGTALSLMNDSTMEVRSASIEMAEGNKSILEEVKMLQDATVKMQDSVVQMGNGTRKVKDTEVALSDIVNKMKGNIERINEQIGQFKIK